MDHRKQIKPLLLSILSNGSAYHDLMDLVHITSAISESYLKHYYPSFLRICTQNGLSEQDLAEDAILEIFARDQNGEYLYLQNFVESLNSSFDKTSPIDIYHAYKSFVQTVAIRQLVKTYAKVDPSGAKIYRNIRDHIRKCDFIKLKKDFRGFVIYPAHHSCSGNRKPFPRDGLEKRLALEAPGANNIPDLLSGLIRILNNQNQYRCSIPLFQVVNLFKRHYAHISNHTFKRENGIDLSALNKVDHNIIKSEVSRTLKQKILTTYVFPQKLDMDEAGKLFQTVIDIIDDWFDNHSERSTYYEHLKSNMPINKSQYNRRWRTKIEYLVRIAREQIGTYLLKGL